VFVKEVSLIKANAEKIKYMLVTDEKNEVQNHSLNIGKKSLENVAKMKYS
jgi:hypothetical protein